MRIPGTLRGKAGKTIRHTVQFETDDSHPGPGPLGLSNCVSCSVSACDCSIVPSPVQAHLHHSHTRAHALAKVQPQALQSRPRGRVGWRHRVSTRGEAPQARHPPVARDAGAYAAAGEMHQALKCGTRQLNTGSSLGKGGYNTHRCLPPSSLEFLVAPSSRVERIPIWSPARGGAYRTLTHKVIAYRGAPPRYGRLVQTQSSVSRCPQGRWLPYGSLRL